MSSHVYLIFPPYSHKPLLALCDHLNLHLCFQCRRFIVPCYAKHPNVALYVIGPLFLLPTPSSPHFTLKFSERDSLWQPFAAAHLDERPHSHKFSRAQRRLNALTPGYPEGTVIRGHPVVWFLAFCPDDAKQDPVAYGADFGVVFLVKGPRTESIQ